MINGKDYKFIANSLGEAQFQGIPMYESLGLMLTHLRDNEVSSINTDKHTLELTILDAYQISLQSHVYVSSEMERYVRALQEHITAHYGSVNEFFDISGIKVSVEFARLSNIVGYKISSDDIE